MSVNLLRNSKVYFTTNVDLVDPNRGKILKTGFDPANTFEIQVLDDLSFSQTTAVETIAVNETGAAPIRGQRTFNTSLNPVDFNFTTYMRPAEVGNAGAITEILPKLGGTAMLAWNTSSPPTQAAINASAAAIGTDYGLNTQVSVAAPAGGRAARLYPIFGDDPLTTATYQKLVGFGIADPGQGYATGTGNLVINVFDPDSPIETGVFTADIVSVTTGTSKKITCEENVLWNAMFSPDTPGTNFINYSTNPSVGNNAWIDGAAGGTDPAVCLLTKSNAHQLQRFGIIVIFDQNCFLLHDCSLNTATIDFGIDAIASIQWSGQARSIERLDSPTVTDASTSGGTGTFAQPAGKTTLQGTFRGKLFDSPFIANKLSTVTLASKIGSYGTASTWSASTTTGTEGTDYKNYTMPLTGGSITLTNNISYLTPAYMGAINQPIAYFTGSRGVTGSLTAYLRTGSNTNSTNRFSANLFTDLINQVNTDSDPEFFLQIEIGGAGNNTKVHLTMAGAVLTIPTVNAESVITTTVNFTAQGTDQTTKKFDILQNNEIMIKYFA